ncbi:hypothetical protein [Treponema pectinovorum]|uniref:hypothetical protein n=1 Tax=Treponema pectinovorum TaxID=164 RepID=UPI0011F1892C|nr:hypothetical protein [Treponema pectinovorum]
MKRFYFFAAAINLALLLLCSCSSGISITALQNDDVKLDFSLAFSQKEIELLKDLSQTLTTSTEKNANDLNENQFFSEDEIKKILTAMGAKDVSAKVGNSNSIGSSASIYSISTTTLSKSKILTKTANSLTLTFGPKEFNLLYQILDEESRGYLDLLMIPCLNDEKMSFTEYKALLASVYGEEIANEFTNGILKIELKSPDLKKNTKVQLKIGELLTLEHSKSWSVLW